MRSITVNASKDYSVRIGGGLLSQTGSLIKMNCGGDLAVLVTDDIVDSLYGNAVESSLRSAGYGVARFVFPHGERSKNTETYVSLLNAMTDANLTRSDVAVALGGGVVGDMAGFAAATYLRGISFVQIPTTVLAMVDSSVGGKTAVDLPAGKNQVGAFYQPNIVLCDTDALLTLSEETFADGCAEMVKHAVILSSELFDLLKEPISPQIEDIIARNITIKRDIVTQDERDTGIRQILNFGHTIGHGIEKQSDYSISHGHAVAVGMAMESRGAYLMGICGERCHKDIVESLRHYNLPTETDIPEDLLIEAAAFDKKRSGRRITLFLPEAIGKCTTLNFDMDELADFIKLGFYRHIDTL